MSPRRVMKKKSSKKKLLKKKLRRPYPDASLYSYKNIEQLRDFITEKGKILPRKMTGLHLKDQRKLAKVIKRARHAGLLPFATKY